MKRNEHVYQPVEARVPAAQPVVRVHAHVRDQIRRREPEAVSQQALVYTPCFAR